MPGKQNILLTFLKFQEHCVLLTVNSVPKVVLKLNQRKNKCVAKWVQVTQFKLYNSLDSNFGYYFSMFWAISNHLTFAVLSINYVFKSKKKYCQNRSYGFNQFYQLTIVTCEIILQNNFIGWYLDSLVSMLCLMCARLHHDFESKCSRDNAQLVFCVPKCVVRGHP